MLVEHSPTPERKKLELSLVGAVRGDWLCLSGNINEASENLGILTHCSNGNDKGHHWSRLFLLSFAVDGEGDMFL